MLRLAVLSSCLVLVRCFGSFNDDFANEHSLQGLWHASGPWADGPPNLACYQTWDPHFADGHLVFNIQKSSGGNCGTQKPYDWNAAEISTKVPQAGHLL